MLHAQQTVVGDVADVRGVEVPLLEDLLDLRLASPLHDHQHPFLRFGQHDLVSAHAGLALRNFAHVDLDAAAAARAHLARRAREPGGTHVLDADQRVGLHQLEAGLEQQLLHERIANLNGRPLLRRAVVELRRCHRRAVDAVASGLRANVVDGIADPGGVALHQRVRLDDAEAEDVDEGIAGVRLVERDLATDGGDADAVAIAGDAGDDSFDDAPRPSAGGSVHRPEAQRVHQRNRPRAHREDVADDSADAGGGTLIGLDERRMVVRFDLEDGGEAAADVHSAGVFTRALEHARPSSRQLPEVNAGALVAAVLRPHHREDAEFRDRRLSCEGADDPVVLIVRQSVAFQQCLIDGHLVMQSSWRHATPAR
jgi:hypothetical protein